MMEKHWFDQEKIDEIAFAVTDLLDEFECGAEEKRIALAQVISGH